VGRLLLFRFTGSMESDPKLPREIPGWGPRLTLEIERIVSKALNYDPKQRFHSAAEFLQALSCAVGEGGKTPPLFEPGEMTAGRDSELEAIEDVLREAAAGDAAALCFVGPRGIGKTRLLAEARVRAQLRGFEVVEARFHRDPLAGSSLLESLRASHGTRRKPLWLAPLAAEHGGSSFERARRAAKAYFLEEGPMLALLLDDLELADRQSGLLAEALIEESLDRRQHGIRGRGLALFVTSVEAGSPKVALLRQGRFTRRLKPLNARQSAALLSALLRPLKTPKHLVKKLARDSRGCPLLLRQMARAVRAAWRETGVVPEAVESTAFFRKGMGSQSLSQAERDPVQGQILRAIAVIARPALPEEIAVAAKLPEDSARKALRRLVHEEVLTDYRRGPSRFYELGTSEMRQELLRQVSASEAREAHERVIAFLVKHSDQGVRCLESLAFHLLAAGRREEGRAKALRTAEILRQEGLLQNAVRLLTEATSRESDPHWRLRLIEEISSVHEEAGDHEEGVAILEPVYRGELGSLVGTEAVRVRRRLGVHYHRAGLPAQALKLFREIGQLAEPVRDVDELVSVDSELAELHTLRGEFGEA